MWCSHQRRLCLLTLLALPPLTGQAQCSLTIGYGEEAIPPYINPPGQTHSPGESIELVTRAAKAIDCQIHWLVLPNMRVLHNTLNGQLDGALLYSWSPERDKHFIYPKRQGVVDTRRRLATLHYMLYQRAGASLRWDGHSYRQLSCPIGYNQGWSIGADLAAHGVPVEAARNTGQNLKKLERGRICGYATLEQVGDAVIAHYSGQLFEKLPVPLSRKSYYLIINPASYQRQQPLIEALWDEIGHLRSQ